jgi:hypothetical protein
MRFANCDELPALGIFVSGMGSLLTAELSCLD